MENEAFGVWGERTVPFYETRIMVEDYRIVSHWSLSSAVLGCQHTVGTVACHVEGLEQDFGSGRGLLGAQVPVRLTM